MTEFIALIEDDDVLISSPSVVPSSSSRSDFRCSSFDDGREKRKAPSDDLQALLEIKNAYYDKKLEAYKHFNEKRLELLEKSLQGQSSALPTKKMKFSMPEEMERNELVGLLDLPDEVIIDLILLYLDVTIRKNIRLTCKRLYALCNADRICKNEKIIWSENISAMYGGRCYLNLVMNRVDMATPTILPFFEVNGAKVRSLVIKHSYFSPGTLEPIITLCESLCSLTLSLQTRGNEFPCFHLESETVTRPNVTYLKLILPNHQPDIYFRRMLSIFPNVEHLKIKSEQLIHGIYDVKLHKLNHDTRREYSAIIDDIMRMGNHLKSLKLNIPVDELVAKKSQFFQSLSNLKDLSIHFNGCRYQIKTLYSCFKNIESLELLYPGGVHSNGMLCLLGNSQLNHLTLFTNGYLELDANSFQVFVLSKLKIVHFLVREISSLPMGILELPLGANKSVTDLFLPYWTKCPEITALAFSKYFQGLVHLSIPSPTDHVLQHIFQYQENLRSLQFENCLNCTVDGFVGNAAKNLNYSMESLQKLEHLTLGQMPIEILESDDFIRAFQFPVMKYLRIDAYPVRVRNIRCTRISPLIYNGLKQLRALRLRDLAMPSREILVELFHNSKYLDYLHFDMQDNRNNGTRAVAYINSEQYLIEDAKYEKAHSEGHLFYDAEFDRKVLLNDPLEKRLYAPVISSYEVDWVQV